MTIPAIILVARLSAALPLLCVIGIGTGIVMFLYGRRPTRKPLQSEQKVTSPARSSISPVSTVQVIRLSPEPDSLKSSEMSQQQKIAAALLKAGLSTSTSWSHSESLHTADTASNVQVMADPSEAVANRHANTSRSAAPEAAQNNSSLKKFLVWAGPLLALLSLYLLLHLKSLL